MGKVNLNFMLAAMIPQIHWSLVWTTVNHVNSINSGFDCFQDQSTQDIMNCQKSGINHRFAQEHTPKYSAKANLWDLAGGFVQNMKCNVRELNALWRLLRKKGGLKLIVLSQKAEIGKNSKLTDIFLLSWSDMRNFKGQIFDDVFEQKLTKKTMDSSFVFLNNRYWGLLLSFPETCIFSRKCETQWWWAVHFTTSEGPGDRR